MSLPTDLEEQLRDIAERISVAASWAGSALHSRRIQELSDEIRTLIGDKPAETSTPQPPAGSTPATSTTSTGAAGGSSTPPTTD